jgi:hypothetical protein
LGDWSPALSHCGRAEARGLRRLAASVSSTCAIKSKFFVTGSLLG